MLKSLFKRYIGNRYPGWDVDGALHYLPIISILQKHGMEHKSILDVGSGSTGICTYLSRPAVGVDLSIKPGTSLLKGVQASCLDLPFPDCSFEVVVSADMLEHLRKETRFRAVEEMMRVADRLVVVAVPCGTRAMLHDRKIDKLYQAVNGGRLRFCAEHLDNGLPEIREVLHYISAAADLLRKKYKVRVSKSANLLVRELYMCAWIKRWYRAEKLCLLLMPLLHRANWGACYRMVFQVSLGDTV